VLCWTPSLGRISAAEEVMTAGEEWDVRQRVSNGQSRVDSISQLERRF
jgi:hypothetical protein